MLRPMKLLLLLLVLLAAAWFAPAPVSHLENTIEISAPRDRVWAVLSDLSGARLWDPQLRDVRFVSQAKTGVGTERESRGAIVSTRERVTEWLPYNRMVLEVSHEPKVTKFEQSTIEVEPSGLSGTRVRWAIDYQVNGGYLGNLADGILFGSIHKGRLEDGLANLKRYAETGEVRN